MKVARCIDYNRISNSKKMYTLKFSDMTVQQIDAEKLQKMIELKEIYVTNLNVSNTYAGNSVIFGVNTNLDVLNSYEKLSYKNNDVDNLIKKARLLGIDILRDSQNSDRRSFNKLVITDGPPIEQGIIVADEIIFIGSKPVISSDSKILSINCEKVIVKNQSLMVNIPHALGNKMTIQAKKIIISHPFIDIYTAKELYSILKHDFSILNLNTAFFQSYDINTLRSNSKLLRDIKEEQSFKNAIPYIIIDYKESEETYHKLSDIVEDEVNHTLNRSNSLVDQLYDINTTLFWVCMIHLSTKCKIDSILKSAEKLFKALKLIRDECIGSYAIIENSLNMFEDIKAGKISL